MTTSENSDVPDARMRPSARLAVGAGVLAVFIISLVAVGAGRVEQLLNGADLDGAFVEGNGDGASRRFRPQRRDDEPRAGAALLPPEHAVDSYGRLRA